MHKNIDPMREPYVRPGLESHPTRALLEMNDKLQEDLEHFRHEWAGLHSATLIHEVLEALADHGPRHLLDELGDGPPEPRDPNANLLAVAPLAALLDDMVDDMHDERESMSELRHTHKDESFDTALDPDRVAEARLEVAFVLIFQGMPFLREGHGDARALLSEDALTDAESALQRIVDADLHPPSRRRMLRLLSRFPEVLENVNFDEPEESAWDELEANRKSIIVGLLRADSLMSIIEADPPPGGAKAMRRVWQNHHPGPGA
jgi:hypothetical protein